MTIALGVITSNAAVLAADRQITLSTAKIDQGKIRVFAKYREGGLSYSHPTTSVLITGAGDGGSFSCVVEDVHARLRAREERCTERDIREAIESALIEFHHKHIPNHISSPLDLWLVIGAFGQFGSKLWSTNRTVVQEHPAYAAVGIGNEHALGALRHTYAPMTLTGAVLMAAYISYETKNSVRDCGEHTDITFASSDGYVMVPQDTIRKLEGIFERYSKASAETLHSLMPEHIGWHLTVGTPPPNTQEDLRQLRAEIKEVMRGLFSDL
jgi:20S proteasome alpha/beta subunit